MILVGHSREPKESVEKKRKFRLREHVDQSRFTVRQRGSRKTKQSNAPMFLLKT